jgi:hypothetical protein
MLNIKAFGFPSFASKGSESLVVLLAAFSTWRRKGRKSAKPFKTGMQFLDYCNFKSQVS